ncbi:hypothetical protein NEHOM01_1089 [Nematocida homosporus]|uniref:uncharacterized protein n=1 Tax=Nematocida homosporus TaxID=1912981 RepID=UPI00222021E6|nr:uncharacterized protein NEHOM01_1089 [Nematocida homosporus]KAI5185812.1 hypothetical protein NEHOM01_1089 [Nematocida homosporus]
MAISIPSFLLRRALKTRSLTHLKGVKEVFLCGKIIRRTRATAVIYDSFCGISVYCREEALRAQIDRSITESFLVRLHCSLERLPRPYLKVLSLTKITFQEEIYRTLESMAYWTQILLQKQPK